MSARSRGAFLSGVEPLDRYLHSQAGQDARRRVSACFVAPERTTGKIAGYYTLAMNSVLLSDLPEATVGGRLADQVASIGGSWSFIVGFAVFLLAWVAINTIILAKSAIDPYPFIFLNIMLSMLAAVQAPVIMMSQNRQAVKDRLAAALDYEVNLSAELAIGELHMKVDQLMGRSQST